MMPRHNYVALVPWHLSFHGTEHRYNYAVHIERNCAVVSADCKLAPKLPVRVQSSEAFTSRIALPLMEPLRPSAVASLPQQAPVLASAAQVLGVMAGVAALHGNLAGMREVARPLVAGLLRPDEGAGWSGRGRVGLGVGSNVEAL